MAKQLKKEGKLDQKERTVEAMLAQRAQNGLSPELTEPQSMAMIHLIEDVDEGDADEPMPGDGGQFTAEGKEADDDQYFG